MQIVAVSHRLAKVELGFFAVNDVCGLHVVLRHGAFLIELFLLVFG